MRLLLALAVAAAAPLAAQDAGPLPATVPRAAHVEFENDRVRVLRVRLEPHERTGVDDHPAHVVVALTRAHTRAIPQEGGAPTESRAEPGAVTWTGAGRRALENLSDEPAEVIEVDLKQARAPAVAVLLRRPSRSRKPKEPMPASLEPHHHVTYENQYVRAMEVTLRPGERSLFHTHTADVLYVILADAVARAQRPGEAWGPQTAFRAGAVSFDSASAHPYTHHLENVGKTRFHTINLEILP